MRSQSSPNRHLFVLTPCRKAGKDVPIKMMTNTRFGKAVEVLIWTAALAVIATNIALLPLSGQKDSGFSPCGL